MAIVDGWLDWALKDIPGHPAKVYREPNKGLGIVCHSVVGDLPGHAVPARFQDDSRTPDGSFTSYAAASVQFILYRDGTLRQMYPVTASTWTSGGRQANTSYWAIEAEGGGPGNYGEPLTEEATSSFLRLCYEFEKHSGIMLVPHQNLFGHSEVARMYGYASTACPSGRYDNAFQLVLWRRHMWIEEAIQRIERLERIVAGHGHLEVVARDEDAGALSKVFGRPVAVGERITLTGRQTLEYLDQMGSNFYLGLQYTQRDVANLKSGEGGVPPHSHRFTIVLGEPIGEPDA